MTRSELVKLANHVSRESRYGGAPALTEYSDAETIARWLQWCDPNGCHTAELARVEDFEPYDVASAWEALADMIRSAA